MPTFHIIISDSERDLIRKRARRLKLTTGQYLRKRAGLAPDPPILPKPRNSKRLMLTRRLVRLPELLKEHRWRQAELATEFGVCRKTIERTIRALSEEIPIERAQEGREVYFWIK
jgi:hypothetical protein